MIQQLDNDELKKRIVRGDTLAINHLYKKYYRKLKLYGTHFSPQLLSLSIDDSIQELFIWITKNHKKLSNVENLEVYLFSALKRNIYQEIQKVKSRKNLLGSYTKANSGDIHEISDESKIIASEKKYHHELFVKNLLNSLPAKQREVVYLRNYVNMTYKEIADTMNLSEQIVRNYSYRAMQKLKENAAVKSNRIEGKSI